MLRRRMPRYEDFVADVRRFRRTDLLRLVAQLAIRLEVTGQLAMRLEGRISPVTQFALAAIAKAAAVHGNEHRELVATPEDVSRLCDTHHSVAEGFGFDRQAPLSRFLLLTAFEQFPWQQTPHHDMGRSQALYGDAVVRHAVGILVPGFEESVLGCSEADYVTAVMVWFAGAMKHGGRVEVGWLDQANFSKVLEQVDRAILLHVLESMTATPEQIRAREAAARLADSTTRRFEFNPLQKTPFVQLPDGSLLAPQPVFVRQKANASGIYYDLIAALGAGFAGNLGDVFQCYIGDNLRLLPDIEIFSEVEWGGSRSVDFFAATANTLVLVEVKSTRLTADARAGGPGLADNLQRGIGKAFRQIRATLTQLQASNPAFDHIPRRARTVAIIVTLEPYFVTHTDEIRSLVEDDPGVPTIVAASHEIEHLVAIAEAGPVAPAIEKAFSRETELGVQPRLSDGFNDLPYGYNPLLEAAWRKYGFE
jgi:hypothetical protein